MKNILPFLFVLILILSCNQTKRYQNRETDKADAEKVINELLGFVKNSDFENASLMFGHKFLDKTPKKDLIKIFQSTENKFGKLKSIELDSWQTMVSEGAIIQGAYNFDYKSEFEKNKAELKISLLLNKNGEIKVVGYKVK